MKTSPRFHEKEVFDIILPGRKSWGATYDIFERFGLSLTDDFAERARVDTPIEVWQTDTLATVDFTLANKPVYPDEEDFDTLVYAILPCTLPEACVKESINLLFFLASELGGTVRQNGQSINREDALALVDQWSRDVLEETGDVLGSESARILLEMKYQK